MKKQALFLYGNRPEPLPTHMMQLLGSWGDFEVKLLYYDRGTSPLTLPWPESLDRNQCSRVAWPVGERFISKIANRIVVMGLLAKRTRAMAPDVIHAWNLDMLLVARMATLGLREAKVVFTLQDTTEWMLSRGFKAIQRWAYRGTDLIFVTSQGFEKEFLRRFNLIDRDKTVVFVPNVPPTGRFSDFEPRAAQGEMSIGCIGLLRGREGLETLVQAVGLARTRGANVKVVFAGVGPERPFVERMAQRHAFVRYSGPYQHDRDIFRIYQGVDVLYAVYDLSYDKRIHLAYRFCEAINCRLPLIVAKGTHMSALVEEYGVGVSVELGDVEGLAERLVELYHSREKRERIALNCERTRPQFVFEYYQEKIRDAYCGLWNNGVQANDRCGHP